MWLYVAIFLSVMCGALIISLELAYRKILMLQKEGEKYSSVQKTFSKAVAGIEANLDQEKENLTRYRKILNTIRDGVAIVDDNGLLQYANSALWNIYGIPFNKRDKYMNASWLELHSAKGQEEIKTQVLPILEAKKTWLSEKNVARQDGTIIRAEFYITKTEEGYLAFISDVTERYHAEIEREDLILQVQQIQKTEAIERIMRTLVHNFTNELSAVNALSEFLTEELVPNSEVFGYAQKIGTSCEQMRTILEQVRFLLPRIESASSFGFHSTTKAGPPANREVP